jgi:hypothetical protein
MLNRLVVNWVYGGFLAALLLLLLAPLITRSWSLALGAVFLQLPVYMLHQYEEHDNDRFRLFFNRNFGRGKEVLSPMAVFVINVPGVWGVFALCLTLASAVNIGLGLIPVYVVLVNGLIHIVHAALFRCYNPGLATAILLFLPASFYGWEEIRVAGGAKPAMQAMALFLAIALNAGAILLAVRGLRSASVA